MEVSWSFAAYLFTLVVGLGLAIASGFLTQILHLGDGDVGVSTDHDFSVDHDVAVGHDMSIDHDFPGHVGDVASHISPLSPPVLSSFLVGFGFSGMFAERALHLPWFLSAPLATLLSLGGAVLAFVIIGRLMASGQGTSHVALGDLVGSEGEVITPIPAEGLGEIALLTPTGRTSMPARSETRRPIAKHKTVTVMEITGNVALVRETIDEQLRALAEEPFTPVEEQMAPKTMEAEAEDS